MQEIIHICPFDRRDRHSRLHGRLHRLAAMAAPLLWVLILPSCRKTPYQDKSLDNKLVVLAEITAGEHLQIPVSKSILVGSGGIISFEKVNGAKVTVTEAGADPWILNLNTSPRYSSSPASVYTSRHRPAYGRTYSLQVEEPSLGTATATTFIPGPVNISGFDTSGDTRNGIPVLKCRFTLADPPGSTQFYIFEARKRLEHTRHYFYWQGVRYDYDQQDGQALYGQVKDSPGVQLMKDTVGTGKFIRLNVFTSDKNTDNAAVSSLDSSFERIFLPDKAFNGQPYPVTIFIDRKYFRADNSQDPGRVLIQIKSVSPELYKYLFWYEQYKSDVGYIPAGQLYSPPGNVRNGLGIFGGSSKRQWVYYFDTLP